MQLGTEDHVIINYTVHQTPSDLAVFTEHMDDTLEILASIGAAKPKRVGGDAGYGSEETYEYLDQREMEAYLKYPGFYQEQKGKGHKHPFHHTHLYYNAEQDYYVCPMGQRMYLLRVRQEKTKAGYPHQIHVYQAQRCEGCPLRGICHQSKANRIIGVNHRSAAYRRKAAQRLNSLRGIRMRQKRGIDTESVFGHIKQDRHFRRFLLTSLAGVSTETGLLAIAHNFKKWWVHLHKIIQLTPQSPTSSPQVAQNGSKTKTWQLFFEKTALHRLFSTIDQFSMNFLSPRSTWGLSPVTTLGSDF